MLRKILTLCFIIVLSANIAYAEKIKDFVIQADNLSYNEDGTIVEARGNVVATHKELTIKTENLTYRVDQGSVNAWEGFDLEIENKFSLIGDTLDYDLKERTGDAEDVRLYFQGSSMTGEKVKLKKEEIELKGSSFTGCSLKRRHYHITASSLILYPDEGWLICYFGYFWMYGVPLVPVPAYLIDLSAYGVGRRAGRKNIPPIPEFGSNEEDGSFINTRFAWFANKQLNGKVLLSYADNNGWGGGIEGNYIYNENNDGDFRIYGDPRNRYFGGLTHIYSFGPSMDEGKEYFYGLFNIRKRLMFELITDFSVHERVNYERLTILPDVTIKANDFPVFNDNFTLGGSLTYGIVSEESTIKTGRGIFTTDANYKIPTDHGTYGFGVGYNNSWYERFGVWNRITQLTSYTNTWGNMDGYLGHLHYLVFKGQSPFNYENYLLVPSDEINLALGYNFFYHRIGIDYTHYVPSMQPKELDYIATIGFHCFNFELTYRATRKEFLFGISLITR